MKSMSDAGKVLKDVGGLTQHDLALIAETILRFGEESGPVPEGDSVLFFRAAYARDCIERARHATDEPALESLAQRLAAALQ